MFLDRESDTTKQISISDTTKKRNSIKNRSNKALLVFTYGIFVGWNTKTDYP